MIAADLQEFYQNLKSNSPIMSVDYGEKKIGIAISNPEHTIAMPLEVFVEKDHSLKNKKILKIAQKYSVCAIVLGLPVNMDGSFSAQTTIVKNFANILSEATDIPIFLQDERLTTRAADSLLRSFGQTRKQRNDNDDPIAASMILETTLDSLRKYRV